MSVTSIPSPCRVSVGHRLAADGCKAASIRSSTRQHSSRSVSAGARSQAAGVEVSSSGRAQAAAPPESAWAGFSQAVGGEWDGVIGTFDAEGVPQPLPEYYVPSAYRSGLPASHRIPYYMRKSIAERKSVPTCPHGTRVLAGTGMSSCSIGATSAACWRTVRVCGTACVA